jgi:hypothetical protein
MAAVTSTVKSTPVTTPAASSLTRADLDALRATLDKLGRCMIASTLVGPHRTPAAVRDQVAGFWEVL